MNSTFRWLVATHKSLSSRPVHLWLPNARNRGILFIPTRHARREDSSEFLEYVECDEYASEETTEGIRQAIERHNVKRIGSATEVDVSRLAAIRSEFDLPGLRTDDARVFTDKSAMRTRAAAAGVRSPHHRDVSIQDPSNFLQAADGLGWPVVVKPRAGTGGRGIEVLHTSSDAERWIADQRSDDEPHGWLIEKFVRGQLYHLDGLTHRGEVAHVWPSSYNMGALEALKSNTAHMSHMLHEQDPLRPILVNFARSLFREFPSLEELTAFHLEAFVSQGQAILCEVACRPAGGGVDVAHSHAFGVSIAREHLLGQLGLDQAVDPHPTPRVYAGWALLPALGRCLISLNPVPLGLGIVKAGLPQLGPIAESRDVADAPGLIVLEGSTPEVVKDRLDRIGDWWQTESIWEV
jgi:hypothetical protein